MEKIASIIRNKKAKEQVKRAYVPNTTPEQVSVSSDAGIPYVSTDQYRVNAYDMGNYGNTPGGFPTYQMSSFDYEIPPNVCLPPGVSYPNTRQYFPGRNTYQTRFDTQANMNYYPANEFSWCPKQFWNDGRAHMPSIPLGPPEMAAPYPGYQQLSPILDGPNILSNEPANYTPYLEHTFGQPMMGPQDFYDDEPEVFGNEEVVEEFATPPEALVNYNTHTTTTAKSSIPIPKRTKAPQPRNSGPIALPVYTQVNDGGMQLNMLAGDSQGLLEHRNVRDNRYPGQKPVSNIYEKNVNIGGVPYTNSLYQTPYDQTKNMISTGKLLNTNTGELYETFENQLPPPNSTKSVIPAYQLKQPNPKFLSLLGNYNHHNPPPRKAEQPGYVFNPTSELGGVNPFGSQVYSGPIRERQQEYSAQDLYNNRNGIYPAEPSLNGERPHGMFGLVPRFRPSPYLVPTNELDRCDYVSNPETVGVDTMQREQYTGAKYARKPKVLVQREVYPTAFINGVEAVASIPIASDRSGPMRSDLQINYIAPASMESNSHIIPCERMHFKQKQNEGETNRIVAGASQPEAGGNTLPSTTKVRDTGKIMLEQAFPASIISDVSQGGTVIPGSFENRNTLKEEKAFPTTAVQANIQGGTLIPETFKVKPTQKIFFEEALPAVAIQPNISGGTLVVDTKLRNTLKGTGGALRVGDLSQLPNVGMIMDHLNVRDTLKTEESAPVGLTTPIQPAGTIITDVHVRDTLKAMMSNPFRSGAVEFDKGDRVLANPHLQDTMRHQHPYANYGMGVQFSEHGQNMGPGSLTSFDHRGLCEQHYIPSQSLIPQKGGGDTGARVVAPLNKESLIRLDKSSPVREDLIFRSPHPLNFVPPPLAFSEIRPTLRSDQEYCDDDNDIDD